MYSYSFSLFNFRPELKKINIIHVRDVVFLSITAINDTCDFERIYN